MRIAKLTGTVTATTKNANFVGGKLMIADITDANGKVLEPGIVATDTCGAGVGDIVLIATGSAARLPDGLSGAPTDASIVAIVEQITLS